jgi:hypothetical protein
MSIPRRLSLLLSLIADFTSVPEDSASVEREIAIWLSATAKVTGLKRAVVRRDLVLQNGYKGAGAQTRLAADVHAALSGNPDALLAAMRAADRDAVAAGLRRVWVKGDVVVAPLAVEPPAEKAAAPVPTTTLTSEWLAAEINDKGLIQRLATMLRRRDKMADHEDLISDAGLWLATWGQRGTFDTVIEEKGHVPFSWLCRALERKRTSAIYKQARNPLYRLRGARTQHEINLRLENDDDDYAAPESQCAGDHDVVTTYSETGEAAHEVVCPAPSPEDYAGVSLDRDHVVSEGREIVAAAYRGAVERYTAVYDALIAGASTEDIMALDGCEEKRAQHLASKVRGALREGAVTVENAEEILRLLSMEPWSTRGEIQTELRIDAPKFNRAISYLQNHALVQEGTDSTFAILDDDAQ